MYPRKILLAATYCGTKTKADRQINFFICFAALWKYNTSSNNWGSDSDSWKFSCCLFPIITGCGQEIFASKISFIKYFFGVITWWCWLSKPSLKHKIIMTREYKIVKIESNDRFNTHIIWLVYDNKVLLSIQPQQAVSTR